VHARKIKYILISIKNMCTQWAGIDAV